MQEALKSSYLDAFLENCENLVDGGKVRVEDGVPNKQEVAAIEKQYKELGDLSTLEPDTVRQLLQLDLLKVIQKDSIQANHQMTPDSIGMVIAYLMALVADIDRPVTILDPAVGTANLLSTVMNYLTKVTEQPVKGFGVDNDESMLATASVMAQLQGIDIDLYHQDAIMDLDVPQTDFVVSDLPVGYYPLDKNTANYKTRAKEGHSYVHHLLIEQSVNYLRPGGIGLFLVPSDLFKTTESASFLEWIQSVGHLQGIINLSADMFGDKRAAKSILFLQRQGGNAKQAKQVLLANGPSFKKKSEVKAFARDVNQWVAQNLK